MLANIRIVLVATSHPGNIGAAARAMKNMGLSELCLVAPKVFPHVEATARAAGADEILAQAQVVGALAEAIGDCRIVIGASARLRELSLPIITPRECGVMLQTEGSNKQVAIVFGRESSGLSNDELRLCNYQLHIPTNPKFSSLNLAAAVQVVVYELWLAASKEVAIDHLLKPDDELATAEEIVKFQEHLQRVLFEIEFLNSDHPRKMVRRLHRLFNKAKLEKTEINILRGILTAVEEKCAYRSI